MSDFRSFLGELLPIIRQGEVRRIPSLLKNLYARSEHPDIQKTPPLQCFALLISTCLSRGSGLPTGPITTFSTRCPLPRSRLRASLLCSKREAARRESSIFSCKTGPLFAPVSCGVARDPPEVIAVLRMDPRASGGVHIREISQEWQLAHCGGRNACLAADSVLVYPYAGC